MAELTLAEKRLLLGLAPGTDVPARGLGFASDAELLLAADMLARKGLLEVKESSSQSLGLTATGQAVLRDGLPERRAAQAIVAAGGRLPLPELGAKAGLSADEATVAIGWLRRKGLASMEKGPAGTLLVAGKVPATDAHADALAALAQGGALDAKAKDAQELLQRGLVELRTTKSRSIRLTQAGAAAKAGVRPDEASGEEVGQLTPELVARWAAMGPDEKARVHLRRFDFDVPVAVPAPGKAHPLTHILQEIRAIFWSMGFAEIAGDYVESAHWNMDALFIPQDHPARDMQDTFYLQVPGRIEVDAAELDRSAKVHESGGGTGSTGWGGTFDRDVSQRALLRTHTTNTTIRYLAEMAARQGVGADGSTASRPDAQVAKVFGLGRVFRKETMDATHLPEFTQIEGIVTEPGATFDTLVGLCKHFFARMGFPEVRFRPAYFPYTEPSMEIDVFYNGRWMELGGCGIFRPEVTKPLGVAHNVVAWGFGLERLAMMRLGLKDIRDLYISDVQWLREAPLR